MNSMNRTFPNNVIRYSALKYLQKKITEKVNSLPHDFKTVEEWELFKCKLIDFLKEALPVYAAGECRPSFGAVIGELEEGLLLERVELHFEGRFYIPVHLYRSMEACSKRPAVIICPGYGHLKNWPDVADICMALAKAGFIAMPVEYDGTGERAQTQDAVMDIHNTAAAAHLLGFTNVGMRVMNTIAALRYLQTREDVDPGRIGITGICQGGIVTWFAASVCEEFKAVAPVCGVTTLEAITLEYCNRQGGWSGASPYVFNLLSAGDVEHLIASIAPRPLFVQNNIVDIHWPYSGFEKVQRFTQRIYGLYGVSSRARFRVENNPHAYSGTFITNLVEWFSEVLT